MSKYHANHLMRLNAEGEEYCCLCGLTVAQLVARWADAFADSLKSNSREVKINP